MIGDARQLDNYTKTTEAILKHMKGSFNELNDLKYSQEELNNFKFNLIKPETPDILLTESSGEEMILREGVNNWFLPNTKYNDNMYKICAMILGQCTENLENKLQARKYWEPHIKNQPISILKAIKYITHNYQYSRYTIV